MTGAVTSTPFRTIVVDDNLFQRTLVKKHFTTVFKNHHFSFLIKEAEDGERAWSICEEQPFEFYVVDYLMPNMNGVGFCRKLFNSFPDATVVLYSDLPITEIELKEGFINGRSLQQLVGFIPKDCLGLRDYLEQHISQLSIDQKFNMKNFEKRERV